MCKQTSSLSLFFLLALAAPLTVCAQPHERFWVVPGDESGLVGVGSLQTVFEFTADVTDAKCYQLDFGDGNRDKNPEKPRSSDGKTVRTHSYEKPARFPALMKAWRLREGDVDRDVNCDGDLSALAEPIELRLQIVVRSPSRVLRPPSSVPEFSVRPSDLINDGIEPTWADFTFDALVADADSYELNFDDGVIENSLKPALPGQAIRRQHRYEEPGVYTAVMTARRNQDDLIRLERQVSVLMPQAVVAVQWPPLRKAPAVRPEPTKPDILPWLLLAAIAALLSQRSGLAGSDPGTFVATKDRGRFEVTGSPDAVSMRVRRNEARFVISDDAVVLGVQPRHAATQVDS